MSRLTTSLVVLLFLPASACAQETRSPEQIIASATSADDYLTRLYVAVRGPDL